MCVLLIVTIATVLLGEQPFHPNERLAQVRRVLADREKRLPDYECVQTVDRRYYMRRHVDSTVPCDRIRSLDSKGLVLQSTDRLRLDIKVSQGDEIGSWQGSPFTSRDIFKLIGGGPYATGMLGSLISDIFLNDGAAYKYLGEETAAGTTLSAYSYKVPLESSHYRVKAGSQWAVTAFDGTFWLDSSTLDLKRLLVQARNLPRETSECDASIAVDYQKVHVAAGEVLLPQQSLMSVTMQDAREGRVTAVYSACHEYRGEAVIHFDEVPVAAETKASVAAAPPLPAGLPFSLALTESIDTDVVAAGDVVRARVRKPILDPRSKTLLVPAGAIVQGRILQMRRSLDPPRHFAIALQLEKLELNGTPRPIFSKVIDSPSKGIFLSTIGQWPLVAQFSFKSDKERYRVPAGYESNWITIEPPQ
jgi:hypothetical protein